MVTKKQNLIVDTQKRKRMKSKHIIKETIKSQREQEKKEQKNYKTARKQ